MLRDVLESLRGATMVTVEAATVPDWRTKKMPAHLAGVKKFAKVNGVINWIYQNSVNNQRLREGLEPNFTSIPRSWGVRIWAPNPDKPGTVRLTPLVKHNDKYYLEVKVERLLSMEYRDENGQIIPKEELKDYLRQRKSESARQELDKEVVLRDYSLDNIISLSMNGRVYQ